MGQATKIEWTDHTFNPYRGCAKVHAGCTNCYAEQQSKRNPGLLGVWGDSGTRVVAAEDMWSQPVKWNKAAEKAGERRRVFCASLADVFEDWSGQVRNAAGAPLWVNAAGRWEAQALPERSDFVFREQGFRPLRLDDVRMRLFALIDATPWLDWQLLTKRPENVLKFWPDIRVCPDCNGVLVDDESSQWRWCSFCRVCHPQAGVRKNVWIGTSISDQATADKYVPELLKLRDLTPVLFLSIEPLLGPVRLWSLPHHRFGNGSTVDPLTGGGLHVMGDGGAGVISRSPSRIDWVIVGGESGPKARPCHLDWVRSIVEQCKSAQVPSFVKQLGFRPLIKATDKGQFQGLTFLQTMNPAHIALKLSDPKGGDPDEWAEDLRVRQIPIVKGGE